MPDQMPARMPDRISDPISDPVTAIRNLGPAMADTFARVGITTATHLRKLGTDAAYAALLTGGSRPHFIVYYCIEMGLQGRPWNDCKGAEKDRLRVRFDAIVARHRAQENDTRHRAQENDTRQRAQENDTRQRAQENDTRHRAQEGGIANHKATQQKAAPDTDAAFEAALNALGVIPAQKRRSDQPTSSRPAKK